MERMKIRQQMGQTGSPFAIARSLGLKGCYKGALSTWCRDIPFSVIFFPGAYSRVERVPARECVCIEEGKNLPATLECVCTRVDDTDDD
jgi:hypothetical protein